MPIQRLNYFTGQFLRENDFKVEQDYHLSMRRSHNRRSHTPGIVHGLEVEAGTGQVVVKAGMAIDPDGREIVVAEDMAVPVSQAAAFAYVVIALDESKTDLAAETEPVAGETRWTETPVASAAAAVPAGAIALAQIASVAANGTVTLNGSYRRIHSAPAVGGDLTIGRDLTVMGNLEVRGQTTQIDTQQMRGNVVLGDADADTITVEGRVLTGHSSGALQIGAPTVITGSLSINGAAGHLTVQGNTVLGNADADTITVEGTVSTGHSSGRLKFSSPIDVTGDIVVSGNVDGRDVSMDGSKLDTHTASTSNPHATTAAQVDEQGGTNQLVAQINAGTGVIADARIDSVIARVSRFHTSTGHDHDGADSKRIAPGNLQGVNESVTAAALNALTGGPDSSAAGYHTHPFVPDDGSVSLGKLDPGTRMRMLKVPLLQQSLQRSSRTVDLGGLSGGTAFDGTAVWVVNSSRNLVLKIDPATNAVVRALAVGSTLLDAIAFGNGFIWVTSWSTSSVFKIDVATHTVAAEIGVGANPVALAVNGDFLWVANNGGNSVSKINMSTNAVTTVNDVGTNPRGLVAVGAYVWVANQGSGNVRKIHASNNTLVADIAVGAQPESLAATGTTFVWVGNTGDRTVSKINVSTNAVTSFPVANLPSTLAVVENFLWVGGSDQFRKIDTTNNNSVATVSAPTGSYGSSMASVAGFLWVCGGAQATKIDVTAHTVSATVRTQESRGMAFDGLHLWVALHGSSVVLKVDINTGDIVSIVQVGSRPHSVAYNGSHVFVTNFGSNSVSKIDPSTAAVVDTIAVGANPAGIAANPDHGTLWVANSGSGTASVFYGNSTSVAHTVIVGINPQSIASAGGSAWITITGSDYLCRVDAWVGGGGTNVNVGAAPQSILFDYSSLWVITGASGTNTLTKVAAGSAIPVPLPSGAVPVKMCFNGSHIVLLCANEQVYKVDIHTNAVVLVNNVSLGSGSSGVLAYDGVSVWAADGSRGYLYAATL
jgi:YVTN family beta-propeller protein